MGRVGEETTEGILQGPVAGSRGAEASGPLLVCRCADVVQISEEGNVIEYNVKSIKI